MAEFASIRAYVQLAEGVKTTAAHYGSEKPRLSYGEPNEDAKAFLRHVCETSAARCRRLPQGNVLFRAQLASAYRTEPVRIGVDPDDEDQEIIDIETACSAERMLPDPSKVGDGRANRKGAPFLYLASNPDTSMAEMRPRVESLVTVAAFKVTRDCRVIDCSHNSKESWNYEIIDLGVGEQPSEPDGPTREDAVWGDIGNAFSKPVASEDIIEYVPTQLIAGELQCHGYDGIAYKSLLVKGGTNLVLFDLTATEQIRKRCLYKTKCVSWEFARWDGDAHWPESVVSLYRHD